MYNRSLVRLGDGMPQSERPAHHSGSVHSQCLWEATAEQYPGSCRGDARLDSRGSTVCAFLIILGCITCHQSQCSCFSHQFECYRDLHKIPELGFEEQKTSQYVRYVMARCCQMSCESGMHSPSHSPNTYHCTAGTS